MLSRSSSINQQSLVEPPLGAWLGLEMRVQRGNQAGPTLHHLLGEQDKPCDTPSKTLCIYGNDPLVLGKGSALQEGRRNKGQNRTARPHRPTRSHRTHFTEGPWTSGSQKTAGAQAVPSARGSAAHCGLGSGSGLAEHPACLCVAPGHRTVRLGKRDWVPGQDIRVGRLGG